MCGSTERHVIAERLAFAMRYSTVICPRCGLVWTSPRPSAQSFERFYGELYPQLYGSGALAAGPSPRGTMVFDWVAESLDIVGTGAFDIGCGDGGLLLAFADSLAREGKEAALGGCDPGWPVDAPDVLEHAGMPIRVWRKNVEELASELQPFSLFLMYDVIEHLLHPRAFVTSLHAIAPPGARLFVSTSCLDNWEAIPPAGWESYYLRLAHTFTFSRATLTALLATGGWEVERWSPAPKGDQWALCSRRPEPRPQGGLPGHEREVLALIDRYKSRL